MGAKGFSDGSFGQAVKKGQVWLTNFCLSAFSVRLAARTDPSDVSYLPSPGDLRSSDAVAGLRALGCFPGCLAEKVRRAVMDPFPAERRTWQRRSRHSPVKWKRSGVRAET